MTDDDAILVGGPRDGNRASTGGTGLLEVPLDGMIHRYVRTTQQREHDGARLTVYNYDGMVSPHGGEPGTENPRARVASPLADAEESGGPRH